jgi:hypothetical protein
MFMVCSPERVCFRPAPLLLRTVIPLSILRGLFIEDNTPTTCPLA